MANTKMQTIEKSRLGRLLVIKGYITDEQLNHALIASHASGKRIGEYLIEQGLISEKQLNKTLRRQTRLRKTATFFAMLLAPLGPLTAFTASAASTQTTTSSTSITALKITSQPKDVTVDQGQTATFTVAATGTGLKYQWSKDSQWISGANSSTLNLSKVTADDIGLYNVKVTDASGKKIWSDKATLAVQKPTTVTSSPTTTTSTASSSSVSTQFAILEQPQDVTVFEGQNAMVSVKATGTGLSYQWSKDRQWISGANSASLTLTNVTASDMGQYNVRVTDDKGNKQWTQMAAVTVEKQIVSAPEVSPTPVVTEPTSPTPTDTFSIVQHPQNVTVVEGQTATLGVIATGKDLSYQWSKDKQWISGANSATLILTNVSANDIGSYNVKVTDSSGNREWSQVATVNVEKQVVATPKLDISISMQPTGSSVFAGSKHTLNVSASGSGTLKYQWRKNGQPIPDAVLPYLSFNSVKLSDAGQYDVVITNDTGTLKTSPAQLDVAIDRAAKLSWIPPTTRANGAALNIDEIAAYRIYHSTEDGATEEVYDVAANESSFKLDNLASGRHYFAITAIDTKGLESDLSNMTEKAISNGI